MTLIKWGINRIINTYFGLLDLINNQKLDPLVVYNLGWFSPGPSNQSIKRSCFHLVPKYHQKQYMTQTHDH